MKRFLFIALMVASGCSGDKKVNVVGFPTEVDSLFQKSCATVECHVPDEQSLAKSANIQHLPSDLDLSSWTGIIRGSDHGSVIIPFNSTRSHLIQHLLGIAQPRMPPNYDPYNRDTLIQSDVDLIRNWIDAGAASADGDIPFENSTRKIFTTNQVNDVVTVIDQASLLEMRTFEIGDRPENESPHGVEVSRDGNYFYVSMITTGDVFKYNALTGGFINKVSLGEPVALIKLSGDDSKLYVTTNFQVNNTGVSGSISAIRTSDMTLIKQIPVGISPHGINLSRDGRLLYATAVYSDRIYVIDTQRDSSLGFFEAAADVTASPKYEPYHVGIGPANSKGYEDRIFVSCRKSGEVRVFQRTSNFNTNTHEFSLTDSITVGANSNSKPIQLAVTPDGEKIFVANSNDSSVTVIKKSNGHYQFETNITKQVDGTGFEHRLAQPNAVAVSEDGKFVYVSNRNKNGAVIPHHGGSGGAGLLTVIDVATNTIVKTIELLPDAYSVFEWEK